MSKTKSIQVRVPVDFWNLLEQEAKELSVSIGAYTAQAIYERYNRDKLITRLDRCPTAYIKQALIDGRNRRSAIEKEKTA